MASFRVDNMRILSAMADARRATEGIPPLGAALAGVVNAASATGDAVCGQRLAEWVDDRAGELIRAVNEVVNLLERLRLTSSHYVNTEAAIADIDAFTFDWTTL